MPSQPRASLRKRLFKHHRKIRHRRITLEPLEPRLVLASVWQNQCNSLDVNNDGVVVPIDALIPINRLNDIGPGDLPIPSESDDPPPYYDTTGDGKLVPLDVLKVINALNKIPSSEDFSVGANLLRDTA